MTTSRERPRSLGYAGGITFLKERIAELRPMLQAAQSYQRTGYLPGEIGQLDWWHTGLDVPVGKGAGLEAFGLVTTIPNSAAHSTVFSFGGTTAEFFIRPRRLTLRTASLIVSSNKTFSSWAEIFGDAVAVRPLVDCLVHHTEVIVLQGDRFRLKERSKEESIDPDFE